MDKKTWAEIKLFSDFSSLDTENKQTFYEFSEFNSFLEKNTITYLNLYNSYIKIILDIWRKDIDFSTYSELDFQIKLLIEDTKVPINKILEFANLKFWNFETELYKTLKGLDFLADEDVKKLLEKLLKNKQWDLIFSFLGEDWDEIHSIEMKFDIKNFSIESIQNLKKQIGVIDYTFALENKIGSKRIEIIT